MPTLLVGFLVICFYVLYRNQYVYGIRRKALDAIKDYGLERIRNHDYDSELFNKALVPYETLLFKMPFTFGKTIAITDEYKDAIKPYFED